MVDFFMYITSLLKEVVSRQRVETVTHETGAWLIEDSTAEANHHWDMMPKIQLLCALVPNQISETAS